MNECVICSVCVKTIHQQEQERITKLLEKQAKELVSKGFWTEGLTMKLAIRVIKGEN